MVESVSFTRCQYVDALKRRSSVVRMSLNNGPRMPSSTPPAWNRGRVE